MKPIQKQILIEVRINPATRKNMLGSQAVLKDKTVTGLHFVDNGAALSENGTCFTGRAFLTLANDKSENVMEGVPLDFFDLQAAYMPALELKGIAWDKSAIEVPGHAAVPANTFVCILVSYE